ncbi:MAG: hypothetical protein J6V82_03035, partial [Clostridia bacterium]|nr:hypothetical protein [Clostridia bacterium]
MFKKSLVWILMLAMLLCTAVLGVSASEVSNGSSEQQVGTTVSAADEAGGSVKSSQKFYQLPNGETVAYPDATVSVKAPVVLSPEGDGYMVWPSGDDTIERPLQIVMNFRANQTEEEASATIFGNWKCDFYLNFDGLAEGSIVADDCYLAGNYGSFGWIVIPADGLELEEGIDYPVVAAYDANLKYAQDICGSVKDFTAAIYVAPAILEANPDFKVSLSLKMTDPENENNVITIGEPAVYDKYSLGLSANVAQPEENGFAATANEAAVEAAKAALAELGVAEAELASATTAVEI